MRPSISKIFSKISWKRQFQLCPLNAAESQYFMNFSEMPLGKQLNTLFPLEGFQRKPGQRRRKRRGLGDWLVSWQKGELVKSQNKTMSFQFCVKIRYRLVTTLVSYQEKMIGKLWLKQLRDRISRWDLGHSFMNSRKERLIYKSPFKLTFC